MIPVHGLVKDVLCEDWKPPEKVYVSAECSVQQYPIDGDFSKKFLKVDPVSRSGSGPGI